MRTLLYQPRHRDASSSSIYALVWMQTEQPCGPADTEECTHFASRALSRKWRYADSEETLRCLIVEKSYFVLFLYKKYSRRFKTLRLNHWWQMEYPGDTFLDLDSVIYLTVNGTVTSLPVFVQNILNCALKRNEAFTGSERNGGKW